MLNGLSKFTKSVTNSVTKSVGKITGKNKELEEEMRRHQLEEMEIQQKLEEEIKKKKNTILTYYKEKLNKGNISQENKNKLLDFLKNKINRGNISQENKNKILELFKESLNNQREISVLNSMIEKFSKKNNSNSSKKTSNKEQIVKPVKERLFSYQNRWEKLRAIPITANKYINNEINRVNMLSKTPKKIRKPFLNRSNNGKIITSFIYSPKKEELKKNIFDSFPGLKANSILTENQKNLINNVINKKYKQIPIDNSNMPKSRI
jgi:transcriptional regulator CtsR